jgi:thiosulfate reductase cytochrome b subunit
LSREISNHLRFWRPIAHKPGGYNVLQRLSYLAVIFIGFPLMIWTGLAMSPAVTSVAPALATEFGGQQSARTIHFFAACLLVLFLFVHIGMVFRAGFTGPMRAMITGRVGLKERHEQLHYTA